MITTITQFVEASAPLKDEAALFAVAAMLLGFHVVAKGVALVIGFVKRG